MMFLRNALFIVALFIFGSNLYAQTTTQPDLNKSLIPPSPEAASLGKFGILPVTLYEGMPNRNVPIYEVKVGKLNLPISLNYNYNGYRPGEESSWVGLGWTLQAQGIITKVIKGSVDDSVPNQFQWASYANILDLSNNVDFLDLVADRQVDTEPDIYIFNIPGHSGKFIIAGTRIFVIPHQDLAISRVGTGFKIIDENGTKYYFLSSGIETTYPTNSTSPGNYTPTYTSAWNLTSIVSSDNNDQINLQYTPFILHQGNPPLSETYSQQNGTRIINNIPIACPGTSADCDHWSRNIYPGGNIEAKRLTSITSNNCLIKFIPETTVRQDLNSLQAFALKSIDIYHIPDSNLVKRYNLNHGYFLNETSQPSQLKLVSVDLIGHSSITSDSIVMPAFYSFEYANETGVYPKSTMAIDRFGYYNGKSSNSMLFEQGIINYPTYPVAANRSVDSAFSINGLMTKFIYPTGGFSTFEYTKNKLNIPGNIYSEVLHTGLFVVNHGGNPETQTGTLNINLEQDLHISFNRDISNYPFGVHNFIPILKIFIPGVPDNVPPIPPTLIYSSHLLTPSSSSNTETFHITPGNYYYTVSCELSTISSDANIEYIKQMNINPGIDGPGMRISTILSYDALNSSTPSNTRKYSYPSLGKVLSLDGYGFSTVEHSGGNGQPLCPIWNLTENIFTSNYSSPIASLISNQFYYDSVEEVNYNSQGSGKTIYQYSGSQSAMDVNLIRQTDFKYLSGEYKKLHQINNTYIGVNGINFYAFIYNLTNSRDGCADPLALPFTYMYDTLDRYKKYTPQVYSIGTEFNRLVATEEMNSDQNGNNPLIIHTDYYYDNPNYTQPNRIVVKNSKNEIISTQLKFPLDYNISPCAYPLRQEAMFDSIRNLVSSGYQNCVINRYNAAFPVWGGGTASQNVQNTNLLNVLRQYKCEANYRSQYASALTNLNSIYCPPETSNNPPLAALASLRANHILNSQVEQIVSLNKSGTEYLISANKNDYAQYGFSIIPQVVYQTNSSASNTTLNDFNALPNIYYAPRISFIGNNQGNIIEQSKLNDSKLSYVWDYNSDLVVAQVTNASAQDIAYTSFESNGNGGFDFALGNTSSIGNAFTGKKYFILNSGNSVSISKMDVSFSKTYYISYWSKNGQFAVTGSTAVKIGKTLNSWTNYEHLVKNVTSIVISGNGSIDELRLYPEGSYMQTYSYNIMLGITDQCDPNNHRTTYEYDPLGRLYIIRDENGSIIKQYDYQYRFDPINGINTNPDWQNTLNTRCKPCPANNSYISNILQQEQKDINLHSPSYNQVRFIDIGPSAACDVNASWENYVPANIRCHLNSYNQNTGEQEQLQIDNNPCSITYGQTRWQIFGINYTICPLPPTCNTSNCVGVDKKCINNYCVTGTKVYTASVYSKLIPGWVCTYHYHWNDGSNGPDYTEVSANPCNTTD